MLAAIVYSLLAASVYSDVTTPFCGRCRCDQSTRGLNVNCSGEATVATFLFDASLYGNASAIDVLAAPSSGLRVIQVAFPECGLRILDLSRNEIEIVADGAFGRLQKMAELDLGHNWIAILNPDVFKGSYAAGEYYPLKSLRTLKLNDNRIHYLHQDLFEHVDSIEILHLQNNPLRTLDYSTAIALASLPNLKELDLSRTQLKDLPASLMHTPRQLKVLNLSGNSIAKVPKTLAQSRALETLLMGGNPLANLSVEPFPSIATLKVLDLSSTRGLRAVPGGAFVALENLEELDLGGCALESFDAGALGSKVRTLKLNDNSLTRFELKGGATLETLDLSGNPLDCECDADWIDALLVFDKGLSCAAPSSAANKSLKESRRFCASLGNGSYYTFLALAALLLLINGVAVFWYYCMRGAGKARVLGVRSFVHPYYSRLQKI